MGVLVNKQEVSVGTVNLPVRSAILSLEESLRELLKKTGVPEPDLPIQHHFAPGAYAREMLIPSGVCVVGKIHKHAHINVISQGTIKVVTEDGAHTYAAPYTFVSFPGTKRAVYALEDTIWTTVHVTNETDLEKIEEELIAKSYDELTHEGNKTMIEDKQ